MENVVSFSTTREAREAREERIARRAESYYQDVVKWREAQAIRREARRAAREEYASYEALRAF